LAKFHILNFQNTLTLSWELLAQLKLFQTIKNKH
jgi:hypothetical protein